MNKKEPAEIKNPTEFAETDIRGFYRFLGHPAGTYTEIRAINPQTKKRKQFLVENEREFVDRGRGLNERYNIYADVNGRGSVIRHLHQASRALRTRWANF